MKQHFILVFVLLATLSIVNAAPAQLLKRVTTFEPCPKYPALHVTAIEPDPLVSGAIGKFHVSGKLKKHIPEGSILASLFYSFDGNEPKLIDYIDGKICNPEGAIDCPYPSKTPFEVILSGTVPILSDVYGILVVLGDAQLKAVYGCARAFVGGGPSGPSGTDPDIILSSIVL